MKKIHLIICSCFLLTAMTCTHESETEHHYITMSNTSDYDIYVDRSFDYPDTSLKHSQNVMTPGWHLKVDSHSDDRDVFACRSSYESWFNYIDKLIVFVFNADTLERYGWEYAKDNNLVSQRYDLSLDDLRQLNWRLTFPPTEEMSNIEMWPPYGTYDSLGY